MVSSAPGHEPNLDEMRGQGEDGGPTAWVYGCVVFAHFLPVPLPLPFRDRSCTAILCVLDRLPLHVARFIWPALAEGDDVIYDVSANSLTRRSLPP
jgi:hypothetical protein